MKKFAILLGVMSFLFVLNPVVAKETGFDPYGYNRNARVFNGTCVGWGMGKYSWTEQQARDWCGVYSDDKIVMKWNAEWDRGNAENWLNPPYRAWENNEWNGMNGGSGAVWHYKIVWIGDYANDLSLVPEGAYGIWGQFAVIMDQGKDPEYGPGHFWFTDSNPTGYGAHF